MAVVIADHFVGPLPIAPVLSSIDCDESSITYMSSGMGCATPVTPAQEPPAPVVDPPPAPLVKLLPELALPVVLAPPAPVGAPVPLVPAPPLAVPVPLPVFESELLQPASRSKATPIEQANVFMRRLQHALRG